MAEYADHNGEGFMQYREDKYGKPLSILGFGCMRFSKKGNNIDIDIARAFMFRKIKAK